MRNPRAALRWKPPAWLQPPWDPGDGKFHGSPGAFVGDAELRGLHDDSDQGHLVGMPFDKTVIVAAPATGTTTLLIGDGASSGEAFGPVPAGFRAGVFGIYPYLEAATGVWTSPRIIGATIRWRLLVDGQPASPYHNITTLLVPWGAAPSPTPLLEVPQRRVLTADVTNTDALGIYVQLGLRLVVRWIPWTKEWR